MSHHNPGVFLPVAKVFLSCWGGVLHSCQGVAMLLPRSFEWFLVHCYTVTRVLCMVARELLCCCQGCQSVLLCCYKVTRVFFVVSNVMLYSFQDVLRGFQGITMLLLICSECFLVDKLLLRCSEWFLCVAVQLEGCSLWLLGLGKHQ